MENERGRVMDSRKYSLAFDNYVYYGTTSYSYRDIKKVVHEM